MNNPGYWCRKLQEWVNQRPDIIDIKFDVRPLDKGEVFDLEDYEQEAYEILTGPCTDITNERL